MFTLKLLLVLVFSFQLSTNVAADLSDDARIALDSLYGQIQSSARLISITGYNLWYVYTSDLPQTTEEISRRETEEFFYILSNLTTYFLDNAVDGNDCIDFLKKPTPTISDPATAENFIFSNIARLASLEVQNKQYQYWNLHTAWLNNCLQNQVNCEGTSRAIIAEVERLLPKVRRTPYELFAEVYVLSYKVAVNLESARTDLREWYNKAIENATTCIASKLIQAQGNLITLAETPRDINESISQSYEELVAITTEANLTAYNTMIFYVIVISNQYTPDLNKELETNTIAYTKAIETINSLLSVARSLNATIDCDIPNVDAIFNSTAERILDESDQLVLDILNRQVKKAYDNIDDTMSEVYSIGIEIAGCTEGANCDYLLEKIASKKSEIPRRIQLIEQSSSVVFQQSIFAWRESSARAIRDALEQAEIAVLHLESCVQLALQNVSSK